MNYVYTVIIIIFGFAFIAAEIIFPTVALLGLLGVAAICAAIGYIYATEGILASSIILAITGIMLAITIYIMRRIFSGKSETGKSGLLLDAASKPYQDDHMVDLIGENGTCSTALRPGGYVSIKGEVHEAMSANGYVEKDTHITVERVHGKLLYVRSIDARSKGEKHAENSCG